MADQATASAAATSPKPEDASVAPVEVRATTADATTDGVAAAPAEDVTDAVGSDAAQPATDELPASSIDDKSAADKEAESSKDTENAEATGEAASVDTNGTSATPKSNGRRKSSGGVPEHKAKKLNKKKSVANLNLEVKPGQYWMARMKGYAAWPVIVCDEPMLPETLLNKRPVSACRADGTYREDFADGGKNVRDRRYPVMFLGTNEFAWQVNTDLAPLDMEDVKRAVANDEQGKKSKALWDAWKVTAEGYTLEHFKEVLMEHEKALAKELESKAQKEAEKAEKAAEKEKAAKTPKNKRKSKGGAAADEDVEMEDAGNETDTKKSNKKRKKDTDSEAEGAKPVKTPKTKLKVNGPKTPAADTPAKAKKTPASKTKAGKIKSESEEATPKAESEPLTEAQKLEKRQKASYDDNPVLFLRHRLQKGFLTRDQPPKEEEMQQMSEHFSDLERRTDIEVSIIKETKINKVLKAIIKLDSIPKDEEYNFKKRSTELLTAWNKQIASETESASAPPEAAANGAKEETADAKSPVDEKTPAAAEEAKSEEPKTDEAKVEDSKAEEPKDVEMKEPSEAPVETKTDLGTNAGDEGDVAMEDAKPVEAAPDSTAGAKEADKPAGEATASA
ncbi:uncharacterized protein K452DRAFT_294341 [Aplosporella prunicola CBS 121167]|uniref:PWWP domain-containing protein n=1 Tax=Aplosporella prunicola CBS 121167 TaxID=1176127 RepID=A0A6A6BRU3_9PEZI|nr:uncharacterized protein K452DRAFT_294341 [Aplosporella prunicola CBS 121167]KAF2146806.1 hypothetical protein K452DRAFT_294341 [Aplosporella prunicola CBS 121167]